MHFLWTEPVEVAIHGLESTNSGCLGGPIMMKTDRGSAAIACADQAIAAELSNYLDMTESNLRLLDAETFKVRVAGGGYPFHPIAVFFDSLAKVKDWQSNPGAFAVDENLISLEELLSN